MKTILEIKKAEWIWSKTCHIDQYVRFYDSFTCKSAARLKISVSGNYAVWINGTLAAFGQYADYPHFKVGDEVDVSSFVKEGENMLCVLAWQQGGQSQTYVDMPAGLLYEVTEGEKVLACSCAGVCCREAPDYAQGEARTITVAVGYSFCYDARAEVRPQTPPSDGEPAVRAARQYAPLYIRPNKKIAIGDYLEGKCVDAEKKVYDLGKESAGMLCLRFTAPEGTTFSVAFGEYLNNEGEVAGKLCDHDYTLRYIGSGKPAEHTSYLRRIGCRYLQVRGNAEIEAIGLYETPYPLKRKPFDAGTPLRRRIYDTAVRTLELCAHEHYEDCPWREQTLYTLDSRAQMLCGYYAFGEYEFARSSLLLMSEAPFDGGFMAKAFPSCPQIPIPSYGMAYVQQMREYAEHSGDIAFVAERAELLEKIISAVDSRREADGLIPRIVGAWNFYEWSEGMDGMTEGKGAGSWDGECLAHAAVQTKDLALNCLLILGMEQMEVIYKMAGMPSRYRSRIGQLRLLVRQAFYDEEKKLFRSFSGRAHYSRYCNALALLSGCASGIERELADKLCDGKGMVDITLATKAFLYDALLQTNECYASFVLADIDRDYGYMLSKGATSFWETMNGFDEYGGVGSLCHGWSAMPVYYYHRLLAERVNNVAGSGKMAVGSDFYLASCGIGERE